ncbi:CIA30 family protein [Prochlorococcus marinus]|uniref:CIA30 family protein n=1 Tax=Prochlorococcus marinus TaxID=1219 RepID=UPI0022B2F93C|nr:CIA30 family protein [Prochlorococcus marinus]
MPLEKLLIGTSSEFSNWISINDTIMGGSSIATCKTNDSGLSLEGELIEENGGFVSCRSPVFSPPLDLSLYDGIKLQVDGQGRTLKLAISCSDNVSRFTEVFSGGLRWVAEFETKKQEMTSVKIPFVNLEPSIRANPIRLPLKFSSHSVYQFQLLYSKFGTAGKLNSGFKAGPFRILLSSLSVY